MRTPLLALFALSLTTGCGLSEADVQALIDAEVDEAVAEALDEAIAEAVAEALASAQDQIVADAVAQATAAAQGLVDDHASSPHGTTDASELLTGTLPLERLAPEVVLEDELANAIASALSSTGGFGTAGSQYSDFGLNVEDGPAVELASVEIGGSGDLQVTVQGHVYVEKPGDGASRWSFFLAADSCSGTQLGTTLWRPPSSSDVWVADVISLTGHAESVPAGSTLVLCGSDYDSADYSLLVGPRGIDAQWAPAAS